MNVQESALTTAELQLLARGQFGSEDKGSLKGIIRHLALRSDMSLSTLFNARLASTRHLPEPANRIAGNLFDAMIEYGRGNDVTAEGSLDAAAFQISKLGGLPRAQLGQDSTADSDDELPQAPSTVSQAEPAVNDTPGSLHSDVSISAMLSSQTEQYAKVKKVRPPLPEQGAWKVPPPPPSSMPPDVTPTPSPSPSPPPLPKRSTDAQRRTPTPPLSSTQPAPPPMPSSALSRSSYKLPPPATSRLSQPMPAPSPQPASDEPRSERRGSTMSSNTMEAMDSFSFLDQQSLKPYPPPLRMRSASTQPLDTEDSPPTPPVKTEEVVVRFHEEFGAEQKGAQAAAYQIPSAAEVVASLKAQITETPPYNPITSAQDYHSFICRNYHAAPNKNDFINALIEAPKSSTSEEPEEDGYSIASHFLNSGFISLCEAQNNTLTRSDAHVNCAYFFFNQKNELPTEETSASHLGSSLGILEQLGQQSSELSYYGVRARELLNRRISDFIPKTSTHNVTVTFAELLSDKATFMKSEFGLFYRRYLQSGATSGDFKRRFQGVMANALENVIRAVEEARELLDEAYEASKSKFGVQL